MNKTNEDNESRELSNSVEGNPSLRQISATHSISQQSLRIAPIPTPEEFEGYKRVMPDFPERILKQFEEDSVANRELQKEAQAANIELNKNEQSADIAFEKRSQWMAFTLMMTGLIGTFVLAYLGKDYAAAATGLSTFVLIFKGVFSKNPSKKTRDNNNSE